MMINNLELVHRHSSHHRAELLTSQHCGCFYCLRIFYPADIKTWINEPAVGDALAASGATALCPHCGVDAVLGDRSGYPIEAEFLMCMKQRWFGRRQC